jgi:hypothetical protein
MLPAWKPKDHFLNSIGCQPPNLCGNTSSISNGSSARCNSDLDAVEKRTEKLEARTRMNSQNSSKPPSTDSPFNKQKKKTKKSKTKRGGQKGHKGYQQQMLNPTNTLSLLPQNCDCGKLALDPNSIEPFCTHQHIELPKIQLAMDHGKLCSCFAIGQKNLRMKISGPTFTQSFCFF